MNYETLSVIFLYSIFGALCATGVRIIILMFLLTFSIMSNIFSTSVCCERCERQVSVELYYGSINIFDHV